ncbi:tubulin polyglutamylase TTLL5 isoform X4 [Paramormyrops kingsleyae]|uniref:tubulin polyglutamylase TTLL5 isoform X4 n=1 Tax=Paramormyrops kingsleyae TaxID=1676925 RepID=UPI003B97B84E
MPEVIQDKVDPEISSEDEHEDHPCIVWSGLSRKIPVLLFYAETIVSKDGNFRSIGERYNLAFKIVRTESRLVRSILTSHGFHEVHPNSSDFNLMWTGSHLKPHLLRSLQDFQKVNHFPRSYELTRKDRLYKNIQRMQQLHGFKRFHIVPHTFLLPAEYQNFCSSCSKDRGPWIVKPVASSRGRGIYLVSNPNQVPLDENILVSRYISEPLLIDDFKFDLRLYVLVTSYDPLIVYLYEEGLSRFATVKYDRSAKNIRNQFMHLTNYSVNKKSSDYVSCDDPEVEDYGNKWSMSAMLRYLKQEGKDTTSLMAHVEDLVIKAVLSAELQIATACKAFVPHRTNCFELYGFDVLIDSNLKPWLLEVNLSPSLACDAPLDLKIKASMISDMFSLVGFVCQDPLLRQTQAGRGPPDPSSRSQARKAQRPHSAQPASANTRPRQRPMSANEVDPNGLKDKPGANEGDSTLGLTTEELKVLRRMKEEHERRGGFIRIFPTAETWELYSGYLEYRTSMNYMLASRLFPERSGKLAPVWKSRGTGSGTGRDVAAADAAHAFRAAQYERKLLTLEARKRRRRRAAQHSALGRERAVRKCTAPTPEISDGEGDGTEDREMEGEETEDGRRGAARPGDDMPTPPQPTSKISLFHILQDGWELSKVQARTTFSSYLRRVQVRLLEECRGRLGLAWQDRDRDQMELVMRFLKRAAGNLRPELQMSLPSPRLPPADRRRLLSLQLGNFIQRYDKETEHMQPVEEERRLDPDVFQEFVAKASESDLEEVLTFYTQKNRSASVFLGTRYGSSGGHADPSERPSRIDVPASKGESTTQDPPRPATPQPRIQAPRPPATSPAVVDCAHVQLQRCRLPAPPQPTCDPRPEEPPPASMDPPRRGQRCFAPPPNVPVSSVAGALQIYSQRMSRPISARPASRKASPCRPRPDSAGGATESSLSPTKHNQQAIMVALRKLVEKQASRQYAASNHISLLTQHLTNLNLASGACRKGAIVLNADLRDTAASHRPPRALHLKTGPAGTGRTWHEDASLPTGESRSLEPGTMVPPLPPPTQRHQGAWGCYQLQFAIQQLRQQEAQSQQLLEQSRARHQAALSSQAFAAPPQGLSGAPALPATALPLWQNQTPAPGTLTLAPKPPSCARDGLLRKTAPQRLHRQAPPEVWAGGAGAGSGSGSSAQHAVHEAVCSTAGLSICSKLSQSQSPKNR